jgi:fatty-acyl-CoA synthase
MPDYGVGSWPARRARIDGASVAFRQGDRTLTYASLAARVQRLAAAFAARGIARGDRVAYLGANDIATFEVFFAAGRVGAIFAPFNWRLAPPEIAYLVSDSQPALIIYAAEFAAVVTDLPVPSIELGAAFEALCAQSTGDPVRTEVSLDDDAVILYTSGTTSRPKGAVLTHANITFNMMNQLAHADVLSSDTAMCMCPLFHATGLGQVSLPTLFKGGTVVVIPKFEPDVVLRTIADLGIASFSAVPTMLQMLADHPDFEQTDLSSVRYAIYGGSPVLERVAVAWQQRAVTILQGYGMTEAAPGVTLATVGGAARRPVSIGVPHFFTDFTFDPAREDAEPGTSGELLVRGPNVFRGYWDRPDATDDAFVDGWYRSGDVVRVDEDGWAYVIDRVKDLIISGGENVYPSEVETSIAALPGILDCTLIAVPDERWGEVGAAFVIPAEPGQWSEASLRAALAGRIAAFKIPQYVHFVADLPRTATGKVRKRDLRGRHDPAEKP